MKRLYQGLLILAFVSGLGFIPNAQAVICYFYPWELTQCQANIVFEDGKKSSILFEPEEGEFTVPACFKLGCHAAYCSDWRNGIRKACKRAWKKKRAFVSGVAGKKIESVEFEGCAERSRPGTGVLTPLDWITRKLGPRFAVVCSNDIDATNWLKETRGRAYSMWMKSKEIARKGKETTVDLWAKGLGLAKPTVEKSKELSKKLYTDLRCQMRKYVDKYLPDPKRDPSVDETCPSDTTVDPVTLPSEL